METLPRRLWGGRCVGGAVGREEGSENGREPGAHSAAGPVLGGSSRRAKNGQRRRLSPPSPAKEEGGERPCEQQMNSWSAGRRRRGGLSRVAFSFPGRPQARGQGSSLASKRKGFQAVRGQRERRISKYAKIKKNKNKNSSDGSGVAEESGAKGSGDRDGGARRAPP